MIVVCLLRKVNYVLDNILVLFRYILHLQLLLQC